MFKNKKVIAIIPAKKNSKKLKNKNFLKINKFNLTELAILSSINNSIIDQTYVTTDSKKIIKIANKFKCKIIKRPKPLCKDSTNADEVIKHAISIISYQTDYYLVYLQPTSPFRNHRHIIKAFNILKKFKKNNLISVKENSENFYKSFDLKKYLKPNYEDKVNINRQKLKKNYLSNGAIYIFTKSGFLKKNKIPLKMTLPLIMNQIESIDINSSFDYKIAKYFSKKIIYKN